MQVVTMVLALLLAVVVSRVISRLSPVKLPLPVLQIAIGALISHFIGFKVELDPGVFFLLFIAPLLFLDGWRIPKNALFRDWRSIITLALGLVVFTVVGVGFLVDWMVPTIPLAVAFALAAILSPTDPVAVSAIAKGAPIPARLMHILEGEALFNDASGLVCFNFAVMAALTGSFSLADASVSFLRLAAGGLLAGIVIAWGASLLYHWLARWIGEEPGTPILISILIPFAAYLAAERVHVSGILAAAAAGISMHYADLIGRSSAMTRMQRSAIWDMLQVALNGIIFVLLGAQLPTILAGAPAIARTIGANGPWRLALYVIVITLVLAALRFVWVWTSLEAAHWLAARRGNARPRPPPRFLAVATLAGVKGAVTLAGILTLPFIMPDGSPFPERRLAIFLAVGVILLSLLLASAGLPLLAKNLRITEPLPASNQERNARAAAAEAAIRRIEEKQGQAGEGNAEIESEAADRVIAFYKRRLEGGNADGGDADHIRDVANAERRFRIDALVAERDELYRLRLARQLDDPLHRRLVREIDLMETSLADSPRR